MSLDRDFFKVHVELREERGYEGEAPKYSLMVVKNNHGSTIYPPFYDREFAQHIVNQLQAGFDAEQAQRQQESEDGHRRFEEQSAARRAAEQVEWVNARVINVGDGWTGRKSTRHGEKGTVLELDGMKVKVRYDDGKVVSAKRSSFEIVR